MKSLRGQISLSILATLLIAIGVIGVGANWFINREFEIYLAKLAQTRSEAIVDTLSLLYDDSTQEWNLDSVHLMGMQSLYDGYLIHVVDSNATVLWDAQNHDMSLCGEIMDEILVRMENRGADGSFVTYTYNIEHNNEIVGTVGIMYYGPFFLSEEDFTFLSSLNVVLICVAVVAGVSSLIMGFFLARRIARPVTDVSHATVQIAEGDYDTRIKSTTKVAELSDLVGAVNHLADTLGVQDGLRKQLTADVAHELRTPLATTESHLEAMIEGIWEPTQGRLQGCYDEVQRLEILVTDLEKLTRLEQETLELEMSRLDLLALSHTVGSAMEVEMSRKKLDFSIKGEAIFVDADESRMKQVLTNLVSNAIHYTPEGGSITLEVSKVSRFGIITVRDSGFGIAEDELPFIFERFYRADKSRSRNSGGSGIGLAIVQSIVAAHRGTISVESTLGKGSEFKISLPE